LTIFALNLNLYGNTVLQNIQPIDLKDIKISYSQSILKEKTVTSQGVIMKESNNMEANLLLKYDENNNLGYSYEKMDIKLGSKSSDILFNSFILEHKIFNLFPKANKLNKIPVYIGLNLGKMTSDKVNNTNVTFEKIDEYFSNIYIKSEYYITNHIYGKIKYGYRNLKTKNALIEELEDNFVKVGIGYKF